MDPIWQFLLTITAFNVLMLPPFIWLCNRLDRLWWEKRRHG
jgi:hypothetical protein